MLIRFFSFSITNTIRFHAYGGPQNAFHLLFPPLKYPLSNRLTRLSHSKNMHGDEGERKGIVVEGKKRTKEKAIEYLGWLRKDMGSI